MIIKDNKTLGEALYLAKFEHHFLYFQEDKRKPLCAVNPQYIDFDILSEKLQQGLILHVLPVAPERVRNIHRTHIKQLEDKIICVPSNEKYSADDTYFIKNSEGKPSLTRFLSLNKEEFSILLKDQDLTLCRIYDPQKEKEKEYADTLSVLNAPLTNERYRQCLEELPLPPMEPLNDDFGFDY